jgi:hypothetical protein
MHAVLQAVLSAGVVSGTFFLLFSAEIHLSRRRPQSWVFVLLPVELHPVDICSAHVSPTRPFTRLERKRWRRTATGRPVHVTPAT